MLETLCSVVSLDWRRKLNSSAVIMLRNFAALELNVSRYFKAFAEQRRSTYILRRRNTPLLNKLGSETKRKLRRKDFYYELVEDTSLREQSLIDLVLLRGVKGIGAPGDVVKITKLEAYEYYILSGAATYATPENIKKYASPKEEIKIPPEVHKLVVKLQVFTVPVFMSAVNNWTIEPWHIRVALRKSNIICEDDCIELPKKTISGPNVSYEGKDFIVTLTVCPSCNVQMRCRIFHLFPTENLYMSLYKKNFHLEYADPIFPEDKELLRSLPLPINLTEEALPELL